MRVGCQKFVQAQSRYEIEKTGKWHNFWQNYAEIQLLVQTKFVEVVCFNDKKMKTTTTVKILLRHKQSANSMSMYS